MRRRVSVSKTRRGRGIRRIAINTGGGDAPGLNAVIRAIVLTAGALGIECVGIRDGYLGLLCPESYPQGGLIPLSRASVRGITHLGGTILGTTNTGSPLCFPVVRRGRKVEEVDRKAELLAAFRRRRIDALIAIGGDGSMAIANVLSERGLRVVGVPKTIDNDLAGTALTFGFDTAMSFATECLDRLHTTAAAHRRVIVVEVMGRYAGWIALCTGVAGSADAILIPEIPYDLGAVARKILAREKAGRPFSIVVVAEGAVPKGGRRSVVEKRPGSAERLGGVGEKVAAELRRLTGKDTRYVVLGHLLRGGTPTAADRLTCLRFGAAAVRCLAAGKSGVMVALDPPTVRLVPLAVATRRMKTVPLDCDTIHTARDLAICLGD
jgi:ATP-dependent phosphofructokinase / diphosphate-dependent phosphofructokinase